MDAAAARPEPIPVYAEMGSINPVFVLAGALEQRAEDIATGLHGSVTMGVGQFCTSPGLIFIESGEATKVIVSWPAAAGSYTLESTASLNPADWQPVNVPPVTAGGFNTVTLPATNSDLFFRLIQ